MLNCAATKRAINLLITGGRLTGSGGACVGVEVGRSVGVAVCVAVAVGNGEGVFEAVAVGVRVGVAVLVGVLLGTGAAGGRVAVGGAATEREAGPKNVLLHIQMPSPTIAVITGNIIFQRSMRRLLRQVLERAAGGSVAGPECCHSSTRKLRCQWNFVGPESVTGPVSGASPLLYSLSCLFIAFVTTVTTVTGFPRETPLQVGQDVPSPLGRTTDHRR